MYKLWLAAMCCCLTSLSFAQTAPKPIIIKGVLIDSVTNKPLDFVTISLADAVTKQPSKSTLTKIDGSFILSNIAPKKYILSLIYVGYKTKTINISGTEAVTNIGSVNLSSTNKQLKEVAVTAAKPIIKQEIDRLSYDTQADPESPALNVLEMLRKVPLISLDADDNIQLKGGSNYKIFINGKPSSLVARSPKDVLRSMPASSIQKIEVITSPPSKYDSEGLDGIINIITNRKVDNGYNASLNLNERFPVGGPYIGGSLTMKQGKFGLSTYLGDSYYHQPDQPNSLTRTTTGTNPSTLLQNGSVNTHSHYMYMGTELSYEIDSLNLITAEINPNGGKYNTSNTSTTLNMLPGKNIGYTLNNNTQNPNGGVDLGINYQLGFKGNKERLFTFSYRYSTSHNNTVSDIDVLNPLNYTTPDYNQTNNATSREQTLQADYVHPLKKVNIEGGLKAILRNNFSDFRYDSLSAVTHQFAEDPTRTNTYNNDQYVLGAYNTYTLNLKTWAFKAGARLEETIVRADFISQVSNVDRNYVNLVPSVNINKKFKNMSTLNFGYTQRIQRPDINLLNPYVDRTNPNFISTGNPGLNAVVANNFQLSYSYYKKGTITVGFSYNFSNNTIQSTTVYDPATSITQTSYSNIGRSHYFSNNINFSYPFVKNMNFSFNSNVLYNSLHGLVNGVETSNSGIQGYFYVTTGYKFKNGLKVNANANYNLPYISLQGKTNSYFGSGISASKEIVKDKLTFSGVVNNPFVQYRHYDRTTSGAFFTQTSNSQSYFRSFSASLNYKFGKLQQDIKKNKRSISNDDKSSSGTSN